MMSPKCCFKNRLAGRIGLAASERLYRSPREGETRDKCLTADNALTGQAPHAQGRLLARHRGAAAARNRTDGAHAARADAAGLKLPLLQACRTASACAVVVHPG